MYTITPGVNPNVDKREFRFLPACSAATLATSHVLRSARGRELYIDCINVPSKQNHYCGEKSKSLEHNPRIVINKFSNKNLYRDYILIY
jgi:hypothetical protein